MNLVELSKEKGFLSRDKLVSVNESYYYLWMCELQKWLREIHNIHVEIRWWADNTWSVQLLRDRFDGIKDEFYEAFDCQSYEDALELSLIESLKLITL